MWTYITLSPALVSQYCYGMASVKLGIAGEILFRFYK